MQHTEVPNISQLFNLSGRVAIVVGASGYLGSEFARTLAHLGASVVVCSRNVKACEELLQELETSHDGQRHMSHSCDVTSRESIKRLRESVKKEYSGALHVLINSVWAGRKVTWQECSEEDWLTDIDASLSGTFRTIQSFAPLMVSGGSIINIASMYGHVAPDYRLYDGNKHVNPPSYSAAKGGVLQLTRYFASFLASDGIRVNAISPGPFPFESVQAEEGFTAKLRSQTMLGRVGKPSDLRGVVALLASDASSYITGQAIAVDGGWTAW
jgi:NAD(P)-dependent dehydrogenase (short-subunit alcohol dehydrogenase family)